MNNDNYETRYWFEHRLVMTSSDIRRLSGEIAFKQAWEDEKQRQSEGLKSMQDDNFNKLLERVDPLLIGVLFVLAAFALAAILTVTK